MQHTSPRRLATAGLILAMLLWASSFIALKLAFRHYDPMVVIFGRMLVASICFLCFLRQLKKGFYFQFRDLKALLFMALCEPCLYFIFEANAIKNTSASQAGMLTAMLPLLVAVTAYLFLKERIHRSTIAGFLIAIGGVCWLTWSSTPTVHAPNPALGNFYEFMAMVCATGYTVALKRLTARYSPFFLTAIQAFVGCLFFLPFLWLPSTTLPVRIETGATLAIVYLGAFVTLGAYGLYNYGLSQIPANQASAYVNLIPVFTVILGRVILNERFSLMQYAAAAIIIIGVYISHYTPLPDSRGWDISKQ